MSEKETLNSLEKEAERRREEAAKKANVPLPSTIVAINNTQVTYTIDPVMLPFTQLDGVKLKKILAEKFMLKFRMPEYNPHNLAALGVSADNLTEESIFKFLLRSSSPQLVFENGRYPTGPDSFVPVELVAFSKESIIAKVNGVTEVAMAITADSFNAFWESTGVVKKWDSDETQNALQMVSFGTSTKVKVNGDVKQFLSGNLCKYFNENVNEKEKIASKINTYSVYDNFKPNKNIIGSWSFEELELQIHTFNSTTGLSETSPIRISTQTKDERGRGIVRISSALPYDDHVKMIESIMKALDNSGKNKG
ncbi:hypothetical protein [Desulfopila inferna]|uniref:hypothetical protein n=1 Tax=Desulfopila inferna TaxID=468528 RepID=UPI001963348F|nr:hypothetical protein [Desulfopila inferna]MBM9606255.1 hypothetical protein [Desulfopila inferna]